MSYGWSPISLVLDQQPRWFMFFVWTWQKLVEVNEIYYLEFIHSLENSNNVLLSTNSKTKTVIKSVLKKKVDPKKLWPSTCSNIAAYRGGALLENWTKIDNLIAVFLSVSVWKMEWFINVLSGKIFTGRF